MTWLWHTRLSSCCSLAEAYWVETRLSRSRRTVISLVGVMLSQRPSSEILHTDPQRNNTPSTPLLLSFTFLFFLPASAYLAPSFQVQFTFSRSSLPSFVLSYCSLFFCFLYFYPSFSLSGTNSLFVWFFSR